MNRRDAIKRTSLMLGFAASSSAVMSILNGCVPKKTVDWQPQFFTDEQAILVADIVDIILPKTDTPGALDVGIDAFIDHIVNTCFSKIEQEHFLAGLAEADKESKLIDEDLFVNMDSEKKVEALTRLESKAARADIKEKGQPFFAQIKSLALLGYFTSEEIMRNHLEYVPVPTKLEGCTDMTDNQKLIVGNHV